MVMFKIFSSTLENIFGGPCLVFGKNGQFFLFSAKNFTLFSSGNFQFCVPSIEIKCLFS